MIRHIMERPDCSIDCPDKIAEWSESHLRKAETCIAFLESGLPAFFAPDVFFDEMRQWLVDRLNDGKCPDVRQLWRGWPDAYLEHALACHAYIRHGLSHWQSRNLYWIQVTSYLAGKLYAIKTGDRDLAVEPLPEGDHSPNAYSLR